MLINETRSSFPNQEQERLDAFGKSRLSFLKNLSTAIALSLGSWAALGPFSLVRPGEAQAKDTQSSHGIVPARQYHPREGWSYASELWQDREWGPFAADVAARLGLTRYFNPDNPAQSPAGKYDLLHTHFLGRPSNLNGGLNNFSVNYLARFGGTRDWAGMCKGLVDFNLRWPQPITGDETFTLASGEPVTITYLDRVGIGSTFDSGDIKFKPVFNRDPEVVVQENLDYFINRLRNEGLGFNIEAGRTDQRGKWYRSVYGVSPDGLSFLATNLNVGSVEIPRGSIKEAYSPLLRSEAKTAGLSQGYFDEIDGLGLRVRYDDLMDESLVNRILYGG